MLQEYKIQDGESIYDVVLKLYGSLELYGKYKQDNITGFGYLVVDGSTGDPYILNIPGDYSSIFNNNFVYNNTIYTILTSTFDGTTTVLTTPNTGPELPYGPGPAVIQISTVSQIVQPSIAFYDPSLYVSSPAELTQSSAIPSTITTLKGQEGQSVYDLCMMTYGDISQVYKLLQDSGISSINETALSQQLFTYDTSLISDTTFYNYLSAEGIIMNTGEGSLVSYNYLDQQNFYFILQENGFRITTS
jgi:hypothetical protein